MKTINSKKADMAVGTLIIFIAMVLVAAIAAGVVIQTATALQNKALLTGERAKAQVGTGIQPILVYGEDGNDKDLESFFIKMKLSPGSDALKFEDMLLEVDTAISSSDNIYGEQVRSLNTTSTEWYAFDIDHVDFNDDDIVDSVRLLNTSHLEFKISNSSNPYFYVNASMTFAESGDMSGATVATPVEFATFKGYIQEGSVKYGTYHITGETTSSSALTDDVVMIVSHGTAYEQGAYSVDYLLKGTTWKDGYLQRGDIVKLAMVAPHTIVEDEQLDVRIVPKTGLPRTIAIVVPDLVNAKRVYMYS
jgi:archaellin